MFAWRQADEQDCAGKVDIDILDLARVRVSRYTLVEIRPELVPGCTLRCSLLILLLYIHRIVLGEFVSGLMSVCRCVCTPRVLGRICHWANARVSVCMDARANSDCVLNKFATGGVTPLFKGNFLPFSSSL